MKGTKETTMKLFELMQTLHDSEINSGMEWHGDSFDVWLGDPYNGIKKKKSFGHNQLDAAAEWLDATARKCWPKSPYAVGEELHSSGPPPSITTLPSVFRERGILQWQYDGMSAALSEWKFVWPLDANEADIAIAFLDEAAGTELPPEYDVPPRMYDDPEPDPNEPRFEAFKQIEARVRARKKAP
jgi:hypothetical protein